ncbi:MAG: tetratricopeptide repeat protein [bacterium]|nr:tetratricopeptide repeat protein [bacterium]
MKPGIVPVCAVAAWLGAMSCPAIADQAPVSSRATGEALVAADPALARNYLAYAAWLEAAGDLPEAAAVLEAGCHRASAPEALLLELAQLHRRLGRLARAEAVAREALVLMPEAPEAHVCLGDVYLDLGWPQSALESYREAVRLAPGDPAPCARVITALLAAGATTGAEEACLRYLADFPDTPDLWLSLGWVFEKQDKLREAFRTYGQVLALDPGSAEALARQGRLFCRFGQFSAAADACRRALQMDSDNLVAHAYLGIACSQLGDDQNARHHARIAEAGGLDMSAVWKKLN